MDERAAVLVVDDDSAIRRLVRACLSAYRILEAATGAEALALARRELPTVVVLDLLVPDPTGIEVLRALKAGTNPPGPAVVVLTGRRDAPTQALAVATGADAYLTKPFSPRELLAIVDELAGASAR